MYENKLEAVRAKMAPVSAELEGLVKQYGENESTWPDGIKTRYDRLAKGMQNLIDEFDALSERGEKIEMIRRAAMDPKNIESGDGAGRNLDNDFGGSLIRSPKQNVSRAWNGYSAAGSLDRLDNADGLRSRALVAVGEMDGLEARSRELLTEALERDVTDESARRILATANPAYRAAFDTWLKDPVSAAMNLTAEQSAAWRDVTATRAALSLSGSSAILPLALDPSVMILNNGTAADIRASARTVLTASSTWNGVTSAGATAEWKTEGSEAADGTPTLAAKQIPVYMSDVSVSGSYEIFSDSDAAAQLGGLIADAFLRQEVTAFITGSGSGAPKGIITAISATVASTVTATTRSVFTTASALDLFRLRDSLAPRYRNGRTRWVSNIAIQSIIQQMALSANVGLGAFWGNMSQSGMPTLLGHGVLESADMASTVTTGSILAVLGDFSQYIIVDHVGGTVVEGPIHMQGSSGRSLAQREYFAWRRIGGDVATAAAFHFLLA